MLLTYRALVPQSVQVDREFSNQISVSALNSKQNGTTRQTDGRRSNQLAQHQRFAMGFLISETQRDAMVEGGVGAIPTALKDVLKANHARVLDFFRSVDVNFDGCISKGEMGYALHSLGIYATPKDVAQLFDALDPDGNGVIELNELQAALRDGVNTDSPKPKKKLTAAQRAKLQKENQALSAELKDMIHQFERTRGLDDPDVRAPPRNLPKPRPTIPLRKASEGKSIPVDRGEWFSHMDSCWLKSPLIRPQTAPARALQEAATASRKASVYDFWLTKHRSEIEQHARVVELEYAEERRTRLERVAMRRNSMLETMRAKREDSRLRALTREEPFVKHRELRQRQADMRSRQRERAWSQDIVFLPSAVAARETFLQRERAEPDYADGVHAVQQLQ